MATRSLFALFAWPRLLGLVSIEFLLRSLRERLQLIEIPAKDLEKQRVVHIQIQVHEQITQACPPGHALSQVFIDDTFQVQGVERFAVRVGCRPTSVGDEVVGEIEAILHRQVSPALRLGL